ncbi:hypothetical protein LPJ59_002538 [Coemansia sp. RSA 2399]|nr:hypothetical protein LPJ59_002538 [Coemansia sp. RSA 2399]KAJ1904731.1 hypothetical protein LPJ81_002325 [Coemansia sp. IMI 209127]
METTRNINWEIGVLEAKTGDGQSLRRAIAKEEKRKRKDANKEKKLDRLPTGTIVPPAATGETTDNVEPYQEKLKRLRIEKARRGLHQRRRIFHSIMKKLLTLEKVRRQRRIRKSKLVLEDPKTEEKEAGMAERAIEENTEILEKVMPIKADDLVECMVVKLFKRSPLIRESLGEYQAQPHIAEMVVNKVAMRILNDIKAVNVIKNAVLTVEGHITGNPLKPGKIAKKEARALMIKEKAAARQKALEEKLAKKRKRSMNGSKSEANGENKGDDDANTKSTFVSTLGDFDSGDDSASTAGGKKRKVDSGDYSDGDDAAFKEIYGIGEPRNRPGQRARRQKFEKIYGDEANHVKLRQKDKKPKRTFSDDKAQGIRETPKPDTSADKLHPSWEAKRKQKEIMDRAKHVKGTKIVFE